MTALLDLKWMAKMASISRHRIMPSRAQLMRRILLVVTAVNLVGMACMWQSANMLATARSHDDVLPTAASMIESVGFALMLPGIFFASFVLLLSRVFGWNEGTTCAIWYFSAGLINITLARSTDSGRAEW